ncbi:hypothetical protein CP532_4062, partial [Ophiocordyceps camponoti-leonardi (nom. inval.)]
MMRNASEAAGTIKPRIVHGDPHLAKDRESWLKADDEKCL